MKTFLMTTAVAAAMATSAYAQNNGQIQFMTEAEAETLMASDLLGARIYATEGETGEIQYQDGMETEWDDIGEINELIVARDGSIDGVILGVGGFLGLGEKNVAIPMDQLSFVSDGEDADDYFIVVNANEQSLEAAPDFMMPEETAAAAQMEERDPMIDTEAAAVEGEDRMMEGEETELASDAEATGEMIEGEATEIAAEAEAAGEALEGEAAELAASADAAGDEMERETQELAADVTIEGEGEGEMQMAGSTDAETTEEMGAANAPLLRAPELERDGYTRLGMAELTTERLNGATVYDVNDENIGEIGNFVLDGETLAEVIVDFGGFLGLGEKQVALPMDALNIQQSADGSDLRIYVDVSEAELEQMPEFEG